MFLDRFQKRIPVHEYADEWIFQWNELYREAKEITGNFEYAYMRRWSDLINFKLFSDSELQQSQLDSIRERIQYLDALYDEQQIIVARFVMNVCIDCGERPSSSTPLVCSQCERVLYW